MNNSQFRRLIAEAPSRTSLTNGDTTSSSTQHNNVSSTPLLGSRKRSSIPMTPRSIAGHCTTNDFARQVAEHKRAILGQGQPPKKKFKSSAAPKGTKFAAGYQDRAALLRQHEAESANRDGSQDQDDKAERIKALEEMVKLQQIDQATFEMLRSEIGVGGDLETTHLVKGLDRRLLERVRRGEDVTTTDKVTVREGEELEKNGENSKQDIDEELESVLEKKVQAAETKVKKGEKIPPPSSTVSTGKMSRDEILKKLKASRVSAAREVKEAKFAEASLGSNFRKIGSREQPEKKKVVETINGRRREVLVITHPDGTSKRKVRWIDKEDCKADGSAAGAVLGMEIPIDIATKQRAMLEKQKVEEQEDEDIFAGVGADYDPFGGISDDAGDESHSEIEREAAAIQGQTEAKTAGSEPKPRDYFSSTRLDAETMKSEIAPVADPAILAALKRAAAIPVAQGEVRAGKESHETDTSFHGNAFLERLRKREEEDAADLDLGFGESRFGDEEDEEAQAWHVAEGGKKKNERRRGPKKRKGNKNEVGDVMAVLERGKTR